MNASLCNIPFFLLEDWKDSCILCVVVKVMRRLCRQMKQSSLKCKSELMSARLDMIVWIVQEGAPRVSIELQNVCLLRIS